MEERIVAAIGNFDGVHIGHDKIIKKCIDIGNRHNLPKYIITFDYSDDFFKKIDKRSKKIYGKFGKSRMLMYYNIDGIIDVKLDERVSNLEAEKFVEKFLVEKYNIAHLVAGYNFRFGYKANGDINLLKELSKKYDFNMVIIDEVLDENKDVSSTTIRKLIEEGKIKKANKLLINYYTIFLEEHKLICRTIKKIKTKKGNFTYPKEGIYEIQNNNLIKIEKNNKEITFSFKYDMTDDMIIFKNKN